MNAREVQAAVAQRIAALPCWVGLPEIAPLAGGMTNHNFRVRDMRGQYALRFGHDLPQYGVLRFNELAIARAAHAAGITPEVVYAADGVMVSRFIEGRTLQAADLRDPSRLGAVVALLQRCHREVAQRVRGPVLMFWVFQVLRNYFAALDAIPDHLLARQLPALRREATRLEAGIGPVDIVLAHNDLLAANFIDDGKRLWLIDWEYAGFNSPLFDLANLSCDNNFSRALDQELLGQYFGMAPDAQRQRTFDGLRRASLLREILWGAVSHHTSAIAFDYAAYTLGWLAQLEERA
ncbi:MAG: phosphotransferase [Burkholderiaceae bacterium]